MGLEHSAAVGAASLGRDPGVVLGQAAHMHFVDNVVLLGARRLSPEARVVGRQHDSLWGLVAAVECALVEDTLRNLEVAKRLGMTCIWVGPAAAAPEYVDFVVTRAADVPGVLVQLAAAAEAD